MALEELKLKLNPSSGGPEYRVTMLQEVRVRSTKNAFSIAPPGLAASENILLGVSGMEAEVQVRFAVHDDGTDKADGSHSSTVVTVEEQLRYLEDTMHAPDFSASWQLDHLTGGAFNDDPVFFEGLDTPLIQRESPKWKEATLRLRRGESLS